MLQSLAHFSHMTCAYHMVSSRGLQAKTSVFLSCGTAWKTMWK